MHTDIELLEAEVGVALCYAASQRKYSASRIALCKAIDILNDATRDNFTPYDNRRLIILYLKLAKAFSQLPLKVVTTQSNNQQNSATSLLLRYKLKPTQDGKDSSFDNKAMKETFGFFINLWNLIHVKPQDRAFA